MITRVLPNTADHSDSVPDLAHNALIFARTTSPYYYPRHKTPFLFVTQKQGKGSYKLNDQPIEISNRDFYFLNAHDELEIRFEGQPKLETLLIMFEEQFVKNSLYSIRASDDQLLQAPFDVNKETGPIPPIPFDLSDDLNLILTMLVTSDMSKEELDSTLYDLITKISAINQYAIGQLNKIPAAKYSTRQELYKRLHTAKEFIHDHICDGIGLDEIARNAGMNKFHLLSNFRRRYGSTPHQYLLELKLQRAMVMLTSQQHGVTEVCHAVGFESIGSFSNTFLNRFGIRPSAMRK